MDFNKPWEMDSLPKAIKENIDHLGLDPEKGYIGDPLKGFLLETGFCPFCRKAMVVAKRCEHVVFYYDLKCSEYRYVLDSFEKYLWPDKDAGGKQLLPDEVENVVICTVHIKSPFLGAIWGYSNQAEHHLS